MSGANSGKAVFTNTDTKAQFQVQFNPKEFKLDEKANWKASGEHATSKPLLTYEKGEPSSVTMDLIFDTTDDNRDVYKSYVEPLRDFLTADVPVTDKASGQVKGMRPPYCLFSWGSFTLTCVIEKVSCTFLMFKSDGTPIRAKVQVSLKEHIRENTAFGNGGGVVLTAGALVAGSGVNTKTYKTIPGDSLSSVASKFNAKTSDIALANNVADGMEFPPNTPLVIPATPELARVLAQQSLKYTPAYWKNDRKLAPYDVFAVPAGDTAYVPSAFEDEGPVAQDYSVPARPEIPYSSFNGTYGNYGPSDTTFGAFTPQTYGDYGDSDFAFGQTTPQTYGDYGESESTIDAAVGFELGTGFRDSDLATSFDNEATPDEAGPAKQAQEYGGYGDSDVATGTSGTGADYGVDKESDLATSFDNEATPDEAGPAKQAQEYGGYGDSDTTTGTSGKGAQYGGYGDSDDATSFDNEATPDTEGKGPTAQTYGGYGDSDKATGTSGEGASYGGHGDSSDATSFEDHATPDKEGRGPTAQTYGGHGDSETATGTSGEGASGTSSRNPIDSTSGEDSHLSANTMPTGAKDSGASSIGGDGNAPQTASTASPGGAPRGVEVSSSSTAGTSAALSDTLRRVQEAEEKKSKD